MQAALTKVNQAASILRMLLKCPAAKTHIIFVNPFRLLSHQVQGGGGDEEGYDK